MYHDIYQSSECESGFNKKSTSQYKISAEEFEKQVKSITEYCTNCQDVEVQFTFDDGGISFVTLVAPILENYNLHGYFFISTKYINTQYFLTDNQIKELVARGHYIGSHSYSHPVLTDLSESEIALEWSKSVHYLETFEQGEAIASVPEGYVNRAVIIKAREAGVTKLYTSEPTIKVKKFGAMEVRGRYVIHRNMTMSDVMGIVTSKKRRAMLNIRWRFLCIIKAIIGKKYSSLKSFLFDE